LTSHRIMDMALQEVALDHIEDSPGPCCMSFGFDLDLLIRSIKTVGLINPPVLKRNDPGNFTIVSGYRRIKALQSLNAGRIACRILPAHDVTPLQGLLLNLHDNLSTRKLNDVEKAMVLSRLAPWVPKKEIVTHYMPLLGLPCHEPSLLFFLEIEENHGNRVKTFVADGRLSLQAVKMLVEIDAISRAGLLRFISDIRFNINQQIQYIDYVIDLSYIEEKPILDIVEEEVLEKIRSDTHMNRPQKAKAILKNLRTQRYPSVVNAENRFKKTLIDLDLPKGTQISAPPYFEGEYYRLEVLFREGEDLKTKLEDLFRKQALVRLKNPWGQTP